MSVKIGTLQQFGHPYVDILVSVNGQSGSGSKFTALVDTGFSGFVSLPLIPATLLGLQPHATTRYVLANGKLSDPAPLAYGFACVDGDPFVQGLISISENTSASVGVDFLQRCGKAMMLTSRGVVFVDEPELIEHLREAARLEAEEWARKNPQPPPVPSPLPT